MLSYQHSYHAGNYADVLKHFVLIDVLTYLLKKEKPFFYLETHAGRGLYDFKSPEALKTPEWKEGVGLLWDKQPPSNSIFTPYLSLIQQYNAPQSLRFYPGSPLIANTLLRPSDRAYFCELHPQEFAYLNFHIPSKPKRFISQEDGLAALIAKLPPQEKRGVIFIDPSYETKSDYVDIPNLITKALKRFETGVYCLWYPIVDQSYHEKLFKGLHKIPTPNLLLAEFYPGPMNHLRMYGTGMAIINPPYTLKTNLKTALEYLQRQIYQNEAQFKLIEK